MIQNILIEKEWAHSERAKKIIERFPHAGVQLIESYEDYFGRFKKPYLHKRTNLNLILASKRGQLVKPAPPAYGLSNEPHFYFVHSFNCIYECSYCYLQGYFHSPDLVFFLNHEEIFAEIDRISQENLHQRIWFHAGEYSDSLALSHVSGELPRLWECMKRNPHAVLELRTKSANTRILESLEPLKNVVVSFTVSPEDSAKKYDLKAPSTSLRLKAIQKISQLGFQIGLHFDPIIYSDNLFSDYRSLIHQLSLVCDLSQIAYVSLGVVRFTHSVYREVKRNYPDSPLLRQEFVSSFDKKVRYPVETRRLILETVKKDLILSGIPTNKIYLCMEDD